MAKYLIGSVRPGWPRARRWRSSAIASTAALLALLLAGVTGCHTPEGSVNGAAGPDDLNSDQNKALAAMHQSGGSGADTYILREGDTLQITFPGAPNLNTVAAIRRDGKIALPLIGEIQVVGMAPSQVQKLLIEKYGPDLQVKEVTVQVAGAAFNVYVSGAVLRPGKITSERPLTLLEAIMEAGGFDNTKANIKAVRVIRNESGRTAHFTLNLKPLLKGESTSAQFALKPSDVIFVPERFYWF